MKVLFCLLFAIFYQNRLPAQTTTVATVEAGGKIMDVLSPADVLFYPQFMEGTVVFRDGTTTRANLNYNSLFDEMHFISVRGDTLALANEKTIQHILIGKDSFYYDQGFQRLLRNNGVIKLATKQVWQVSANRLNSAFNSQNASSAITAHTAYHASGSRYGLVVNETIDLRKTVLYYFGNAYNHFVPADKKNLLSLFPKAESPLQGFLKEQKIDFSRREDLEKIVRFLGQQ